MTAMSLEVYTQSPRIDARDLDLYYDKFHALKNISLQVPEKQVTASISPSGCGKSTSLRTFNGMCALYPGQRAEGQINMDDESLLISRMNIALLRAKAGMVFRKLTPFLTSIYDNIAFGVELFERLPRSEMDDRVEWALAKAALWNEVEGKLSQSGYGLSDGQQQCLCIVRGIAIHPEVLPLDESCSALDPVSTDKIEELVTELEDDYTVVIITHNMQQATHYSGYTTYMYLGEPTEFGDTKKTFIKPQRKGTEDYITGRLG